MGVARNSTSWQIQVGGAAKRYIGTVKNEKIAASVYDIYVIMLYGVKAKTNLNYNKQEVLHIVENCKLDDLSSLCKLAREINSMRSKRPVFKSFLA